MTTRIEILDRDRNVAESGELGRGKSLNLGQFLEEDQQRPKLLKIFCSPKDDWTSVQIFKSPVEPLSFQGVVYLPSGRLKDLERSVTLRKGEAFEIPIKERPDSHPRVIRFSHR